MSDISINIIYKKKVSDTWQLDKAKYSHVYLFEICLYIYMINGYNKLNTTTLYITSRYV